MGLLGDKNRKPRGPTRDRKFRKEQWTDLHRQKSDEEFSEKTRINRTTFNLLLNTLWDGLVLTPTNFVPEPTSPDRQLAASLYRLAHGVTYTVLEDVLGISKESGCVFFNKVIRLIVAYFYDEYVKLPETDEQWEVEIYRKLWLSSSRCMGCLSYPCKIAVKNFTLTLYNKRFLYVAVGAPGSKHS